MTAGIRLHPQRRREISLNPKKGRAFGLALAARAVAQVARLSLWMRTPGWVICVTSETISYFRAHNYQTIHSEQMESAVHTSPSMVATQLLPWRPEHEQTPEYRCRSGERAEQRWITEWINCSECSGSAEWDQGGSEAAAHSGRSC